MRIPSRLTAIKQQTDVLIDLGDCWYGRPAMVQNRGSSREGTENKDAFRNKGFSDDRSEFT